MKTLYFLRHAQATTDMMYGDMARPLTEKGLEQVEDLAQFFQQHPMPIECVLCSSATRTQETLEGIRPFLGNATIDVSDLYYQRHEHDILGLCQKLDDDLSTVLYVGHNPGISFAAFRLLHDPAPELDRGISPSSLVGVRLPITRWEEMTWGIGDLLLTYVPLLHAH